MIEYAYSENSKTKLDSCTKTIKKVFEWAIKYRDGTIACGNRGESEQDTAFKKGLTELRYPNSNHNSLPSRAVDAVPYIDGKAVFGNTEKEKLDMAHYAGFIVGASYLMHELGMTECPLRWGGDWNCDGSVRDHKFLDFPHFEEVR